ncbi:hypothetical protein vBAcoSR7M_21 [Alteromonas phage vB_AcoS-R7M]|uniref:Uncharacterized protein n=1 Tax=Alteromonas phage vB_AcoS-R7M TaxID=2729541 RepID=A0A6M3YN48_9CAUD|nr:hypothetical protein HWD34_gp21 [Alteromonas phage vB_AcoS-R7M]QJI53343.1 hypothetical protein vBAcoSR7M_21 [Alteromonas phage vB_AcoS-R7M]
MVWLKFFKLLLQLSFNISKYLETKQLLNAGEAIAIRKGLEDAIAKSNKAMRARNAAGAKFDSANGVPDNNDPNLRD